MTKRWFSVERQSGATRGKKGLSWWVDRHEYVRKKEVMVVMACQKWSGKEIKWKRKWKNELIERCALVDAGTCQWQSKHCCLPLNHVSGVVSSTVSSMFYIGLFHAASGNTLELTLVQLVAVLSVFGCRNGHGALKEYRSHHWFYNNSNMNHTNINNLCVMKVVYSQKKPS